MKKINKMERLYLIIKLISRSQEGMSIDEIHQEMTHKFNIAISRKTLERDIGLPSRFQLAETDQIEVTLSLKEIKTILSLLEENTETHLKLKKILQSN